MKKTLFIPCAFLVLLLFSQSNIFAESNINFFFNKSSPKYNKILVKKVIKADIIVLESGEKIKLIGLNAPEPPKEMNERFERTELGFVVDKKVEDPGTSIAESSYIFASDLLVGKYVRLEFDVEKTDDDFNTLAYVFLLENKMFVNTEILRQGFANLRITPPNMKYAKDLRAAYKEARKNLRGFQGE